MRKLFLALLVPLAALGAWWFYRSQNDILRIPFARATRETLVSTLTTNGKVEPVEWAAVHVEKAGLVQEVLVQQGQAISKDEPIATMTTTGLQADVDAAQARVAQARADLATIRGGGKQAQLTEIQNSLEKARLERDQASREYGSLQRLAEKQAATAMEVAAARGKLRQAELDIEALERKRAALVNQNDRTVAEARLREAEAALDLARSRLAQTVIRSPLAGTAYEVTARPGAYLQPGDLVARVGRLDHIHVRIYVDEPEVGRVAVGQPVTITWDALPGKKWSGTVQRLPTEIIALGTRQVGEVLTTVENPGRELVPGTSVTVEIRTAVAENALTIPKEALRRGPGGVGLFVLDKGTIAWRNVETGVSSITRVQITRGISEGQSVALPTETPLREGQRVEPIYP